MPLAEFRLYFNNESASEEVLDRFEEVQVDHAIGMSAEAELKMNLPAGEGEWADVEEDAYQPLQRVRVEVRVGTGEFIPLLDGPIVSQRFELSAAPDRSTLTLVAQDDSVLLNQQEDVELFEDTAPDEVARTLMQAAGLTVEADSVQEAGSSLTRYTVRRGTAMQLLRSLARRHGMFVYVRPGDQPGQSVGVFARPDLTASDLPELLLMGADRNVNQISVEMDALRPMTASAGTVRISDKSVLSAEATTADLTPLGDSAVHELVQPASVLLARTREEQDDLDAATQAAVNASSWAYTAHGELAADVYSGVLQPYKVVRVAGAGGYLAGDYLIARVTHVLSFGSYRQRFTLWRNARLNGGSGSFGGQGVF